MSDTPAEPRPGIAAPAVSAEARRQAVEVAGTSIGAGLRGCDPVLPDRGDLVADLREPRPVFVTVLVDGDLNGCIGSITADEPVGRAVARHAWAAAFNDPRLPRLRRSEMDDVRIEVSVLSGFEPVAGGTARELAAIVRRDVDGLLIRSGTRRALFLPSVWSQLGSEERFVVELFHKAGLDPADDHLGLEASVFTTTKFGDRVSGDVLGAG